MSTTNTSGLPETAAGLPGYRTLSGPDQIELSTGYNQLTDEQRCGFGDHVRAGRANVPEAAIICPTPKEETARMVLAWIRTLG